MPLSYDDYLLHSILYAKGHYKHDDNLSGLRVMVGHYSGVGLEYINDEHLMHFALMLMEKYNKITTNSDFIARLFRDTWMYRSHDSKISRGVITQLDVVNYVLSEIRHIKVVDLPPLPVADETIYPIKEKQTDIDRLNKLTVDIL